MSSRKRGAIASVLDMDVLVRHANEQIADDESTLKFHTENGTRMLLETEVGPAVLDSEGVGYERDGNTITVNLCYGITMTPVDLPLAVIEKAKTDQRIDIADGIRTFGDRLDANHQTWFSLSRHTA